MNIITENCGYDHGNINDLFRESRSLLLKPLVDAILGTDSKHGFKTMFKSNLAKSTVEAILGGIYYGKVKAGLRPVTDIPKGPRLSCVSPNSAQMYKGLDLGYDPWDRCLGRAPGGTPIPAFYADGTAYLFLCPSFFVLEKDISKAHCPTVQNNEFEGDPDLFYRKYQSYTLIYHLLRFYLGENALDRYSDPPEKLDWNDCVRLGSRTVLDTVRNPTSLQLYIACEPSFSYGTECSTVLINANSGFAGLQTDTGTAFLRSRFSDHDKTYIAAFRIRLI